MIEISQHLRVPLGGNISLSKPCTTSGKLQCLKKILIDCLNLLSRPTFILSICKIKLSLTTFIFILQYYRSNNESYQSGCELFPCFYLICIDNLTDEQKQWFIDFYKKLCHVGLEKNKASSRVTTPVIDKDRGGRKVSHQCV